MESSDQELSCQSAAETGEDTPEGVWLMGPGCSPKQAVDLGPHSGWDTGESSWYQDGPDALGSHGWGQGSGVTGPQLLLLMQWGSIPDPSASGPHPGTVSKEGRGL